MYASDDPEEQWNYFLSVTRPVLDTLAPEKRLRVRNPVAPPITEQTKELMARRRAALREGDRDAYKHLNRQHSQRSGVTRERSWTGGCVGPDLALCGAACSP